MVFTHYSHYLMNQVQSVKEHLNKIRQDLAVKMAKRWSVHRRNTLHLSTLGASFNVWLCWFLHENINIFC